MAKLPSKFLVVSSIAAAVVLVAGAYGFAAYDVEKAKQLTYPIGELGNCRSFEECKAYCNKDENIPRCNRFSIKNGLLTEAEIKDTERLLSLMEESGLPGKCRGAVECFSYCESAAHTDECWDYAKRHNLVGPEQDVETIRRMAKYAREGGRFPGDCRGYGACRAYCDDLSHLAECALFAETIGGIIPDRDLEIVKKMVKAGVTRTPGGCRGKEQCEAYCGNPIHMAECADFGEKAGIMTKDEVDMMRQIARSGVTKFPGGCRSKEACDAYCQEEAHFDECIGFAEKVGMVTKGEVELARKTHGKTPGDCAKGVRSAEEGKRACSAFCAKSENQQICMDFAVQIGLITADDAKELGGGGSLEDFNACLPHINEEMLKCFDALGKDVFEKLKAGQLPDDPQDLKVMLKGMKEVRACMNRNTDEAFGKMTKDFPDALVCLEKELGPNPIEIIKSGRISCREFPELQEKIKSCFSGLLESQLDQCLSLACSDVTACFNKLGGGDKKSDQSQLDPAIMKRVEDKIHTCAAEQIHECLAKDCGEVTACFGKLKGGGGAGETEGKLDPGLEAQITAKIQGCTQTQNRGGGAPPPGGGFTQPPQGPQVPEYKIPEHQAPEYPQVPGGSPSEIPVTPELCASFASTPACSYVGSPDSQNYQLCKQCFPDR